MSKGNNELDMVMTLGYADENKLNDIPPKEQAPEDLKITIVSPLALLEMAKRAEVPLVTVAAAKEYSPEDIRKITMARRHGMSEVPSGNETRDEDR